MDDLNSRQLKLIKYLMKIKNTTAAKLAFYLNVSSKTIYQDLDNVADFLGKHQVKVTRKPGTGIELHGNLKKLSIFLLTDRKRINVPNNDSQ
ncbi:MAG: HTH domain-containing protein, partial [Liquorilactobacillus ghanensis]